MSGSCLQVIVEAPVAEHLRNVKVGVIGYLQRPDRLPSSACINSAGTSRHLRVELGL